jgi:mannosyltransferase OCH1-like enzyme
MTGKSYLETLDRFKQNEKPEVVLILAENPELIGIVVAWTNLDVRHVNKVKRYNGESETVAWDWLWKNTTYNMKILKESIGKPTSETVLEVKMRHLINNRVIYPDGTVNSYVQRYLREQVIKMFDTKPKKS